VGSTAVVLLTNGNYVVLSAAWDNGAVTNAGAATFSSGTSGITGAVSAANSLVGTTASDFVGSGAMALANGNYVVFSRFWDNGPVVDAGAATFGSGIMGITGPVSAGTSLVGSQTNDAVGMGGVTALSNGNYVVRSPNWDNGAVANPGAATFGSGTSGISGAVSALNSLVGSTAGDQVSLSVTALTNGNYVVLSPFWDNGAVVDAGAATFGSGASGTSGVVSSGNSLVGSTANDEVGGEGVTPLANVNYVVRSPFWDNGPAINAGAVTFASGTTGFSGTINAFNSLIGSTANDFVGNSGVTPLSNGNYVVLSRFWHNGAVVDAGAATFGNGASGTSGVVSTANSLVGSQTNDLVGIGGVTPLSNGNYVVRSQDWHNGPLAGAGAVTFGRGTTGVKGTINSFNSAIGAVASTSLQDVVVDDQNDTFFGRFRDEVGGIVRVGSQIDGFNAAPVIANFGGDGTYTENADPLLISNEATVSDVDSLNFANGKLRVNFSAGGRISDRFAIRTVGTGAGQINVQGNQVRSGTLVIGTFTGGTGTTPLVVTLTGRATPARVQTLLRNITYRNTSDNPPTAPRTVRVSVSDGDGEISVPVTKQITIATVNDAPVLAPADGGTVGYQQNTAPIALLSNATVTDPDSANFAGGRLLVRIISGGNASNRLLIAGAFELDGNLVKRTSDGLVIGTRNTAGGVGTTRLEITFNANATRAIVQQLVRGIRFRTVNGTSTVQRVIEFSVSDGGGGASNKVNKTVNVS